MSDRFGAEDFVAFFDAVHGDRPFPWQRKLAARVLEKGWPSALDAPTGAGKTATIDIAVFHLAAEAARGDARRAPVRILFVVDRRLVVDDAFERARKIACALRSRHKPILARMADALANLAESPDKPLAYVRLRGGMPREPDWVRTPSQPIVILSTIDQVGSRFLFRGYGISRSMRPVQAGLLGRDALWLLDEAHLAQPLIETTRSAMEMDRPSEEPPRNITMADRSPSIVLLSATHAETAEQMLGPDDRRDEVLARRLSASKRAELVSVKDSDSSFEGECVARAIGFSRVGGGAGDVVAIVVNRVATARSIFSRLEKLVPEGQEAECALLIGRTRELDRKGGLSHLLPRMRATDRSGGPPLFIVATQTIEAGADLDFDALVSEIASLDALRQRFGRLNRVGRKAAAPAAIVARDKQVSGRAAPDPTYGDALRRTWAWLYEAADVEGRGKSARRFVDFGIDAAPRWLPKEEALRECLAPREKAPILMPAFLDRWSRTSPEPADDPDVAIFLHGPQAGPADVQVVWRADVLPTEPDALTIERVQVCPPSGLEALSVPYVAVRKWLAGESADNVPDLVNVSQEERPPFSDREVFLWRGATDPATGWIPVRRIRPGDTIVVPSSLGGCDRWGWDPRSRDPVPDLGEEANRINRRIEILRLSSARLQSEETEDDAPDHYGAWQLLASKLELLADEQDETIKTEVASWREIPDEWREVLAKSGTKVVRSQVVPGLPIAFVRAGDAHGDAVTEDDSSSVSNLPISLRAHSNGVEAVALQFAQKCGLSTAMARDVAIAAFLHDAGKAAPAFQMWLHGGDELAASIGEPLAKSTKVRLGRGARERSGLPKGARHEVASIYFALAHPRLGDANDRELVLWLIGTHHGWGRPFFPAAEWPSPGSTFRADLGEGAIEARPAAELAELTAWWIELSARLHRKYGRWGLAHLEAILRLADHRRSEKERRMEATS